MNFYSMTNVGRLRLVIINDVLKTASSTADKGLVYCQRCPSVESVNP